MMERMKMTKHAIDDRMERLVRIAMTVGWGKVIKVKECTKEEDSVMCLTDTGVMLIKDKATQNTLITAYVASIDRVTLMYEGHPPRWIIEKVKKAQKAYRRG